MARLKEHLNGAPSKRKFVINAVMADVLSQLAEKLEMTTEEIISSLLSQIVSVVQASTSPSEHAFAAEAIAASLRARLTVTGHTADPTRRII
jgi:hypothetical protein